MALYTPDPFSVEEREALISFIDESDRFEAGFETRWSTASLPEKFRRGSSE